MSVEGSILKERFPLPKKNQDIIKDTVKDTFKDTIKEKINTEEDSTNLSSKKIYLTVEDLEKIIDSEWVQGSPPCTKDVLNRIIHALRNDPITEIITPEVEHSENTY